MNKFSIWLSSNGSEEISAYKTEFFLEEGGRFIKCTRGKLPGALIDHGTFQWTAAVKAMVYLAIMTKAQSLLPDKKGLFIYEGFAASLPSSLDYSISKETCWLSDMFGTDSRGRGYIKKLLLRSNVNRKHPGPVCLAFNQKFLEPTSIDIIFNGKVISSAEDLLKLAGYIDRAGAFSIKTPSLEEGDEIVSDSIAA